VRERAAEVLELRSALFENGREDVRAARKLLVVLSVASLLHCFKRLVDLFSLVTSLCKTDGRPTFSLDAQSLSRA